ncbi:MAG: nucleoside deaminase [Acidobacteria bacterium]|jgi:tRNA(Arg) A34 adenosine deaminase TadA|nr:nucleoside deaminase [Acidobacteriota bacterium]
MAKRTFGGPDTRFMRRAIREARRNLIRPDGGPFGACVVKDGRVVAAARNTVLTGDPTAHAEVNAIRRAAKKLGTFDLSGCEIYSTTEPCPMCFGAIHWARVGQVFYGTAIRDAARAGFHELAISNARMKELGRSRVVLVPGFLRDECLALFEAWAELPGRRSY